MKSSGHNLNHLSDNASEIQGVRGTDLDAGDMVLIFTRNSVYSVQAQGNRSYLVSGGWFDRKGLSPLRTTISGCTWGGSIINVDFVAACGMCVEFGNRVITSTVQKVCLFRNGTLN